VKLVDITGGKEREREYLKAKINELLTVRLKKSHTCIGASMILELLPD